VLSVIYNTMRDILFVNLFLLWLRVESMQCRGLCGLHYICGCYEYVCNAEGLKIEGCLTVHLPHEIK